MAELRALLFDVDGTLADTERDGHRIAFNQAFQEAGLDWHWSVELYGKLLGVTGGKERIFHYLEHFNHAFERPVNLTEFIAGLHRNKTRHYMALMEEGGIPLRPGVQRLLSEAREAGFRLAIATTTTPENVNALIASTLPGSLTDWFEVVGAGDIVPKKKPAPDIYQWVLNELVLAPEEVVVFEDSANGVAAARDANISKIIVTTNDYTRDHDFSAASVVLDQLGEPDGPARCIEGTRPASGWVDLAFLKDLAADQCEAQR